MMKARDHIYSEEAQSILGKIPSWIVRWGVTIIALIFCIILIGSYYINYPEIVKAQVSITTLNPPSELAARYTGLLDSVCVKNGQQVCKGQVLMIFSTPVNFGEVELLECNLHASQETSFEKIINAEWLDRKYNLGELQTTYSLFQQKCLEFRHYLAADNNARKKQLLIEQIKKSNQYYDILEQQYCLLLRDLKYEVAKQKRDSLLFSESVISEADYQVSVRSLISKLNSKAGFEATLSSTELNIIQVKQQVVELSFQKDNEMATYERDLNLIRQQLLAQLAQWKEQYIIVAPTDGTVSLLSYWSKHQRVSIGDVLVSVVPKDTIEVVGRMLIPSAGFGKVLVGQSVNVKLNGFPYIEFGVLKGVICSISAVPETVSNSQGSSISYPAEVVFSSGLTTSYNRKLPMIQKMDGTAEIVTEDMSLISRFFRPVFSLFKN